MANISAATLQEIRSRAKIAEVIGDFVSLKRKGNSESLWACCPFHEEKTPSFVVHAAKGFYKCFGCSAKGDLITFLKEHQAMEYLEALRYLAGRYGIPWQEEQTSAEGAPQQTKEGLYIVLQQAQTYYQQQLASAPTVRSYLTSRHVPEALAAKFGLGYSPNAWQGFYEVAKKLGYEVATLEAAGLVIQKEGRVYDRFRDRLMFPIYDMFGRVIGFGGRKMDEQSDSAKYLNSPETVLYHKSEVLYGLYQAKQAIKEHDCCVLVEGYFDVLACHQAGIAHVVGVSGTALTEGQIHQVKRLTSKVVLVFDGDKAGQQAAVRSIELLLKHDLDVRVVTLPGGDDPASYGQRAGYQELFTVLSQKAVDFVTFMTAVLATQDADATVKAQAIQEVIGVIASIPDPIRQAVYLERARACTGIPLASLEASLKQALQAKANPGPRKAPSVVKHLARLDKREERVLLYLLFHYGNYMMEDGHTLAAYMFEELEEVTFQTPLYADLLARLKKHWETHATLKGNEFLNELPEEVKKPAIDLLAEGFTFSPVWESRYQILTPKPGEPAGEVVYRNLLWLKLRIVQQLIEEHTQALKGAKPPEEVEKEFDTLAELYKIQVEICKKLGTKVFPK